MAGARTALVTGSGRNIGRAIAVELASAGFNVVVNGSSDRAACDAVAAEVESHGVRAVVAMGDVGVRDEAMAIAEHGLAAFGRVDVLVNNAAVRPSFDLIDGDEADFHRIMDVDFHAAFWLSRACLPGMLENSWGRVVNFTGMNAQQGYPGKSAVSVAKHAAWALTKAIAKDYGRQGVTANIVSPGTILGDDETSASTEAYVRLQDANPSGRLGAPRDIAKMVAYLAGDDAGFVNGQLMQVNGGVVV